MDDKLFLAWLAGFFDGEGSVGVYVAPMPDCKHKVCTYLTVSVTQTSLPCLERIVEAFGGRIITSEHRTPNGRRWAVQYRWKAVGPKAKQFLEAIYPYVFVKRAEVTLALTYPVTDPAGRKYGGPANPLPDEVIQLRLGIAAGLKELKKAGKTEAKPPRQCREVSGG